jgi:hypothetical protein
MSKKFIIDKQWLIDQYITNKLSGLDIANIIGCSRYLIYKLLEKYGVEKRTLSEAQKNIGSDFPLLNNKEWLINEYTVNNGKCKEIALKAGAKSGNEGTVIKALKRFNIKNRSKVETRLLRRIDYGFFENKDYLDGSLLGDGTLELVAAKNVFNSARFSKRSKHYEYSVWNSQFIFKKDGKDRIFFEEMPLNGKKFKSYKLRSLFHQSLMLYFNRWYKGTPLVKIVPRDVCLSPFSLLIWFLDDGSSSFLTSRGDEIRLTLCSMGFVKEDQQFLCEELMRLYRIKASINKVKSGTGYTIRIHRNYVPIFYNVIGPCPDALKEVFGYKWKSLSTIKAIT